MLTQNRKEILVIMTGGTICSRVNKEGRRYSDVRSVRIIENFYSGPSPYSKAVDFVATAPLDILSENMVVDSWNVLLDMFYRHLDWARYSGIIILHGTDTLAYTSSLLSIALSGAPIPIMMVASQLPLGEEGSNGNDNFRAAVELILNGIAPNVYAVYKNSDGKMYAHYGAHLLQCRNYSDDFYSVDAMLIDNMDNAILAGSAFETSDMFDRVSLYLTPCVLTITPYVGLNYNNFALRTVKAVVHGTYHSDSVCVERKNSKGEYSQYSILRMIDRCSEKGIPLFLAPCTPSASKYESTSDALSHGAYSIANTTAEMAYVKTLIGCAMGYTCDELYAFVNTPINGEHIYSTAVKG